MLKLAILGAQTTLGRELVSILEDRDCSVLPLATGPMTQAEEEDDLVVFAPVPSLLEGLDALMLLDTPQDPALLEAFPGRILDLRLDAPSHLLPVPPGGRWPDGIQQLRGRSAVELALMAVPALLEGLGEISGVHLKSVSHLGDQGIQGLLEQSRALIQGQEPPLGLLPWAQAFDLIPQVPRGTLVEIKAPIFHGDMLILQVKAPEGGHLDLKPAPEGAQWSSEPPTTRSAAVSNELMAFFHGEEPNRGVLILAFDPILWGSVRQVLKLFEL